MIFDLRISNFDLLRSRPRRSGLACRYGNRGELIRFLKEWIDVCRFQKFGGNNHLQPKTRLVGLFLDHTGFMDKVGSRFCPAESSIISRNRAAAPNDLVRYSISAAGSRQRVSEVKNPQSKFLSAFFHFMLIH